MTPSQRLFRKQSSRGASSTWCAGGFPSCTKTGSHEIFSVVKIIEGICRKTDAFLTYSEISSSSSFKLTLVKVLEGPKNLVLLITLLSLYLVNTIELFLLYIVSLSLLLFLILLSLKLEFVSILKDKYLTLSGSNLQYPSICLHLTSNFFIKASNKFVNPKDKAFLVLIIVSTD